MEPERSPTRAPVYPAVSYWVVCDGAGASANPGARLPGRQLLGGVRWSRSVRQPGRPSTRPSVTGWCAMEPERSPTRAPVYPAVSYWMVCDGAGAFVNPGARLPSRQLLGGVRWSRSVRQPGRPSTRPSVTGWCAMEPERPPTRAPVCVIFFYACSGQRQFSTVSFSGFGLWVRARVLGSDNHNRFPNSNPNLNHNSNRNLTLTPILTPNSS